MKKLIIFCLVVCNFLVGKAQLNPPVVEFTSTLGDTVYNTGPFVITAKVASRTYAPIITPKLMYAATYNSITTYDSIVMTSTAGDTMWVATIPQHIYGTSIVYSINAFDSIGNNNYAQKGLYIQRISGGGGARVVTIQNGSGSQVVIPINSAHNYSYTQQIYTAAELNGPGMINAIAFDVSVSHTAQQSIDVYIAHTTQNTIASAANVIPGANLTLVYSGNYTFNTTGWNTIVLQTPFLYNGTDNIVVAVDKNTGASSSGLAFYNEATVNSMGIRYYGSSDISPLTFGGTATVTNNYRPNIRFSLLGSSNDSNSVKLLSIDNPTKGTNGGLQPVRVTIKNAGIKYLDSCYVDWTLNGVLQSRTIWRGYLPEDFNDTITLGYYTQPYNMFDTIVVWVSMPNGVIDSITYDDTLRVHSYGCYGSISGDYIVGVGAGADVPDFATAFFIGSMCGVNGDVTLKFQNGVYNENWDFTDLADIMGPYTLTITSLSGNKDDVVLNPASGVGIVLNNTNNLIIKNITINATQSNAYAIQFVGDVCNIAFLHNNIYSDTVGTSSTTSPAPIYKASSTGIADSVTFIGNVIRGGYYGIYFYGGTSSSVYGTRIIFDSNLITNQYYYATYFYYTDFNSVSHNTLLSRTANTSTYWYGLRFYYCNFVADGNKIQQRSTAITYPYLAYIYYAGYYNTLLPSVFINNELIGTTTSTYYGIYAGTSNVLNMYHNSIYMSGTGGSRNIYIASSTTSSYDIKNNIVVNDNASGYPIYFAGTTTPFTSNYNCFYGVGYVGYYSSAQVTLASWQTSTNQDTNSISVNPVFVNVINNLELSDYSNFIAPRLSSVSNDIEGRNRTILTMMGAYSTPLFEGYNLAMSELLSPVEVNDIYCFDDYTDLTVSVKNAGTENFDLSVNNLSIHVDVAGPLNFQFDTIISIGSLSLMSADTFNLTDMFPVYKSGTYQILVYLSSILDTHYVDDTLRVTYTVKKIDLPYDEDFSVSPSDIIIKQVAGTVSWQVESGADTNPVIAPVYGSGRMAFASQSGIGSISQLIFNGLDLRGALNPTLEFWYAQDGDATENDFMLVKATTNGGVNFQVLETIYRYNASLSAPAWTYVVIDLSSYDSASCLSLVFEANSFGGANQNIDRIRIASVQDVAVRLITPEEENLVACNLDNQTLQVVVENMTPQAVNFDVDTTKIVLKVSGAKNLSFNFPLSGILQGLQKDTITICDTFDLSLKGNYQIEAYIQAVDTLLTNDTTTTTILINPDLQINYVVGVDEVNCKFMGDTVFVSVMIENTGNLKVVQVPVSMQINGGSVMSEFFYWDLNPGESLLYDMGYFYIVPQVSAEQPYYQVKIKTELSCDADSSNNIFTITACVEIPEVVDLQLQSINKPIETLCDSGLHIVNVSVTLENAGTNDISAAVVHVEVDSAGVILASFSEVSDAILSDSTLTHVFTQGYSVPNLSGNYTVKVFVEAIADDEDLTSDTLVVDACAILNDVSVNDITEINWTLGQNIPNPAKSLTSIPYVVPQDGEVIFTVMSINGQILYREVIQILAGSHALELNTDKLSNGMYYYSMEYKGQRIVKKMTIQQ